MKIILSALLSLFIGMTSLSPVFAEEGDQPETTKPDEGGGEGGEDEEPDCE